jgi:hypothetical protein
MHADCASIFTIAQALIGTRAGSILLFIGTGML